MRRGNHEKGGKGKKNAPALTERRENDIIWGLSCRCLEEQGLHSEVQEKKGEHSRRKKELGGEAGAVRFTGKKDTNGHGEKGPTREGPEKKKKITHRSDKKTRKRILVWTSHLLKRRGAA